MNRVLSSGTAAGDGLLKRAMDLRLAVQKKEQEVAEPQRVAPPTARGTLSDPEKKKPSQKFWKNAA